MNKPIRLQRKRVKGWKMPKDVVYVGRPSYFGNPFSVVRLDKETWAIEYFKELTPLTSEIVIDFKGTEDECREEAVRRFKEWLYTAGTLKYNGVWGAGSRFRLRTIMELAGKNLICWCPLDKPCHADELMRLANGSI